MPPDIAELQRRLADAFRGQLDVTGVLGVGGFGAVFRAHDPVLERDVAIKVLDASRASSADNREQFLREARIVATVEHPHIVPLYGAEIRDGLLCLTMRLVPGHSLAERLAGEGPLPPAAAARLAHEVAQALTTAHARGVVHRDVKPDNILLDADGHAIVTDFGISLITGRASDRSTGVVIGTPQYLSPEQALGEAVDGRADVYSLGVVLFEMLTGKLPFASATTSGLLAKQILETPPSPSRLRPELPDRLVAAVNHALAKSPGDRPTAKEFAGELALARTPDALLAPSEVRRRKRRRRLQWITLGIVMGVAGLGVALWAAFQGLNTLRGGAPPSLSATGATIPPALIAEARADGSLQPDEVAAYVFVPHGLPWSEALIITDSAIIRRSARDPRRHALDATTVMQWYRSGKNSGLWVRARKDGPRDTLFTNLTGAELGALNAGFATLGPRQGATVTSPPTPATPPSRRPH
ncbi:MAG: serine/threonine protein kinase [Gemmatimonadetes bacterium]|nr:serine/threonine protein kinase [Gemmatimonadota bacterium]MBK7923364.1 serine/threonine protein kinase [Gemmatimonadota bacterium]